MPEAPPGGVIPRKRWEITSLVGVGLALSPATCGPSTGSAAQGQDATLPLTQASHLPTEAPRTRPSQHLLPSR
jgi:hypothetical protein